MSEGYPSLKAVQGSQDQLACQKQSSTGSPTVQVQVLQEQAKRPAKAVRALPEPAAAPKDERLVPQHAAGDGPNTRNTFHGLPSGATSFTGLAELLASDRSAPQAGSKQNNTINRCRPCEQLTLLHHAALICHARIPPKAWSRKGVKESKHVSGTLTQTTQAGEVSSDESLPRSWVLAVMADY